MIRLLFVLFVTLGGFAALAVWSAREDDDRGVADKIVSPELRAAMQAEVDRLGLNELASKRPIAQTPVASEPQRSVAASPAKEATRPPAPKRVKRESAAAPEPPQREAVAKKGAGGSVAPIDADSEPELEIAELTAPAEFARDFGPASDRGTESTAELLPTGDSVAAGAPEWDELPHDADRSARLIRRMLAVYREAGVDR
jgi:hypothetical protein